MKAEDLKTKTADELQKLLLDARKDQFNQRFQKTNGTLEKVDEIRKARRAVARIKTFLNARLQEEKAGPAKKKAAAPAKKKAPEAKKKTKAKKAA